MNADPILICEALRDQRQIFFWVRFVTMRVEPLFTFKMRKRSFILLLAGLVFFLPLGFAQTTQPTTQLTAPPPASASQQPPPADPSPTPQAAPSPQPAPSAQPQGTPSHRLEVEPVEKVHQITPEEAKELFRSVDEILRFASKDTGLPIKKKVKRTIVSRPQVEKYVGDKFKDDADRIRFERSELVEKKFGLLPRTFDLHSFLIKLLTEQVAGYYDEKTRTMNLLDWNEPEMQRPVMAHELTHALQDQSFNLEKMSKHDEEVEKHGLDNLDELVRNDEDSTCRSAVLEGQAMIVLLDYVLAPQGQSVEKMPQVVDLMQDSMDKSRGSPVFDSAPLLLAGRAGVSLPPGHEVHQRPADCRRQAACLYRRAGTLAAHHARDHGAQRISCRTPSTAAAVARHEFSEKRL